VGYELLPEEFIQYSGMNLQQNPLTTKKAKVLRKDHKVDIIYIFIRATVIKQHQKWEESNIL
jgi:hypothetical protein